MSHQSAFINEMIVQSEIREQQSVSTIVKIVLKLDDEINTVLNNKHLDQYPN